MNLNIGVLIVLAFLAGFVGDVIWALYIRKVSEKKRLSGALFSVGTGICTVIFVGSFIESIWITPCWLFGLFCGTYYSEEIEKIFTRKQTYEQTSNSPT